MICQPEQQNDEWFCQICHIRWATDEDKPHCPWSGDSKQLRIAKCIVGPRLDVWLGREKMLELRDHKWSKMSTKAEREDAMNAAAAIIKELDLE